VPEANFLRRKKSKPAPIANPDFKAVQEWYKMEQTRHTFEIVRDTIGIILERKLNHRSVEYQSMTVGLICSYARPFTWCEPVGNLDNQIIPPEFQPMHGLIMDMRHKIFAHAEATLMAGPTAYPNEVVIVSERGKRIFTEVSRPTPIPGFLERMVPLVNLFIEKTTYHRDKNANKFVKTAVKLGEGEFRLNFADPTALPFKKLSKAEIEVRRRLKRDFDPNSDI
jgi:hypothetical protein